MTTVSSRVAEGRAMYSYRAPRLMTSAPEVVYLKYDDAGLDGLVHSLGSTISFDLEWLSTSKELRVDIVILADVRKILVIQMTGCDEYSFPQSIGSLLGNGDMRKVGQGVLGDAVRLGTLFDVVPKNLVDLSEYAKSMEQSRWRSWGQGGIALAKLCEAYVGVPLLKESSIRCGDWAGTLSEAQLEYAACDAYAGIEIHEALEQIRRARETQANVMTNFADFVFNCDWRRLDELSGRRENRALGRFEELKAQASQERQAGIVWRTHLDGQWYADLEIDGIVSGQGVHPLQQRAKGNAAKAAMRSKEWAAWLGN